MASFGVGYSEMSNSFDAGIMAAKRAVDSADIPVDAIDLCFLFCTSRHEADEFFNGVRKVLGSVNYFGGFANGTITGDRFGYDGYQTVVGVLSAKEWDLHLFRQDGIAFNEFETGLKLFQQVKEADFSTDPQMILFFDAVNRQQGRFQMNFVTPFLDGAKQAIGTWPNIAGARLMGDMKFKPTFQWFKDEMIQNSATALAITGNVTMDVLRLEGCTPASAYHTVTENDGATILEIDHEPATDFIANLLGPEIGSNYEKMKFFVTMGKNLGDKLDRDKASYVNRMCVGINPKRKGIVMAEMDLEEGSDFQLMRRGFEKEMIESEVTGFLEKIKLQGKSPVFGMYLNCAGRAMVYSQNETEDVTYVQNAIAGEFPLIGIYEAGELAMINGDLQVFDWTGVLCVFSKTAD